jgi:hypothetical protein
MCSTPVLCAKRAPTRSWSTTARSRRAFANWCRCGSPDFYPSGFLPSGVRLSGYFGDASDLPQEVLQDFLDTVAAGKATVPIILPSSGTRLSSIAIVVYCAQHDVIVFHVSGSRAPSTT